MAVNIYDTANTLEQQLRETKEFKELKTSYEAMKTNKAAFDLFKDFQEIQMQLSQKQMNGEELTDEEVQKAHDQHGWQYLSEHCHPPRCSRRIHGEPPQ